jgi:DNA-binding FadR family transcriptional regulator
LIAKRAADEEIDILEHMIKLFWERSKHKTSIQERYIHETSYGLILAKYSHNPLIYRITTELFEVLSEIDYKVVEDDSKYKEILEMDLKTVEALQERDVIRALFLDCERMRLIKKILAGESELLNAPCKIKPSLFQPMQADS